MVRLPQVPAQLRFSPFRGRDAVAAGLLSRRMLAGPAWQLILPDIYLHADALRDADHSAWCDAAGLMLPDGGAIGGLSAAHLWGAEIVDGSAPVTIVLPREVRMRPHSRLRVIRSSLPSGDVTALGTLPVTTPPRTAFDIGRWLPRTDAVVAVDALLGQRVLTLPKLIDYVAGRSGWLGVPRVRGVLALAEPLAESPMESRLRLLIIDAGLPRPVAQHEILAAGGRLIGRADLAYPAWRIAIEYEGDHHRGRASFRRDVHRLNVLRAAGWLVLRFTADDVLRHPERTAHQIAAAIRERR